MSNSEQQWKFTGHLPHNDLGSYRCLKCGATGWLPPYGTLDQLKPEKCEPAAEEAPAVPANAPSYEELVNALVQVRHATAPDPDDGGYHEAAHDIADAVLKRVATVQCATPEPLACHVCGSTSEQHFNGCGIAEFCPETGRPIPRQTEPPATALTKEERELLLHTLCGLNHDRPSYRNRYSVYPISDPHEVIKRLVSRGMMERVALVGDHGLLSYRATDAGAAAVGKTLPKD